MTALSVARRADDCQVPDAIGTTDALDIVTRTNAVDVVRIDTVVPERGGADRAAARAPSCRRGAFLLAWLLCAAPAAALDPAKAPTQYARDFWTPREGLPQAAVHSVTQTPDGYLWLGTPVGLVAFDGVRFRLFDKGNSGLSHNHAWALFTASDGALWISTEGGGASRYKNGTFTTFSTREGLSSDIVRPICQGQDGAIWIGTEGGGVHRFKDGTLSRLEPPEPLGDVWAMTVDHEGALWIGTNGGGLTRYKDGRYTRYTRKEGLPDDAIWYLYEDRRKVLWIGTSQGLARLEDGRFHTYSMRDGLPGSFVRSIREDRDGNLWIATFGGVARLRDGHFDVLRGHAALTSDFVRCVYEDREGSLWIGSLAGGLDRLRDARFTTYGVPEGMADDTVRPIIESREGGLWLGTANGGLHRFKDGRVTAIFDTKQGLLHNSVLALTEGRDGSLWIGTNAGGLNQLKDGRMRAYLPAEGLPNRSVKTLLEARDGTLWIATTDGLARRRDGRFEVFTIRDGLPVNSTRALLEGRDGALWIGTAGGLACWKDGSIRAWTKKDGLPSDVIESLYEDEQGALWIGTNGGGLSQFAEGRFRTVSTGEGLYEDVVHAILDDRLGNLWLTSKRGISRVAKAELDEVVRGTRSGVTSVVYDASDGMRSGEPPGGAFQPAACRTRDGRLWFPTIKGLVSVDPAVDRVNPLIPPVVIEEVKAGDKALRIGAEETVLPPGAGAERFVFRYTALSMVVPSKVRFLYKLEGLDADWIDPGVNREVPYTSLRAGSYRFRVKASNETGLWNETGASFAFRIQPRFRETTTFVALSVLSIMLVGAGGHHLRVRQLRARERDLARRVDEAVGQIRMLRGLLPICASCKKIRDDTGYWNQMEAYIVAHSEADFSHSVCPDCLKTLYPQFAEEVLAKDKSKL